ncbi:hypothetical protein ACLOJK_022983 [Asimina triloba]
MKLLPDMVLADFNGWVRTLPELMEKPPVRWAVVDTLCLVADGLDDSDQLSKASSVGKWTSVIVAALLLGTDRSIDGSPDGSHAQLPLMVMEHHISVLRRCIEDLCTCSVYFVI